MKPKPAQPMQFDAIFLSELACPACLGELRHVALHLVCAACARAYPVIDGIPVLIAERAAPVPPQL
jgi:hypothetical protein